MNRLAEFPRYPLAHLPTPLERLERLEEATNSSARLWIKRDDCTGLAQGGNKTRKLEFLVGDAIAQGATSLVTFGGVQSNHARQTAAAAARAGLPCALFLTRMVDWQANDYETGGNIILDQLLGAEVHIADDGEATQENVKTFLQAQRVEGLRPYVIPAGGSNAIGALGYVHAITELAAQCETNNCQPAALVHATSSGGTQAGILSGVALTGITPRVVGINTYNRNGAKLEKIIADLSQETATLLDIPVHTLPGLEVDHSFLGTGYGIPTEEMASAVNLMARSEGILLDPVYTGKGMAGFLHLASSGEFANQDLLFMHTGGSAALTVYRDALL